MNNWQVLAGLSRNQLKHLLMYHSLAKHYTLAEFDGLSQSNPVKTLAGGRYAVNVTYDGGVVHVMSRWSSARVVGSVYESAAMAVYELDTVLLPDALFHAHPPVAATPPVPALPSPAPRRSPAARRRRRRHRRLRPGPAAGPGGGEGRRQEVGVRTGGGGSQGRELRSRCRDDLAGVVFVRLWLGCAYGATNQTSILVSDRSI